MKQLASVIYIKDKLNKKTLMLHRNKKVNDFHKDLWLGIGGKFESCESPEDCVRRETFEETGLKVNKINLKGIITFPRLVKDQDWVCFVYDCFDYSGEISECTEGTLHWIDDCKLLELNLWQGDRVFLPWVFENNFFSAKFNYVDKKLIDYSVEFY